MINSIDPSTAKFLADLSMISQRIERAQRQISSGSRITRPSDAPEDVSRLLEARAEADHMTQIHTNLGRVKSEVDLAEGALESAVKIVERVTQIGAQGATGTQTPETRSSLAVEVRALHEQLVGIAGTSMEGRYLFSGDQDQVMPYTLSLNQSPTGVASNIDWNVTQATRQIMHPAGSTFSIAKTAQEIFDSRDTDGNPAADNVFAAVNSLRIALENGPTVQPGDPQYQAQCDAQQAAINSALVSLRKAGDHLNGELAFYGSVQNQVDDALDLASKAEVRDKTALSDLQDTDLASAILEMTQAQTHQQAALSTRAQMPRSSLFDYLG